MCRMLGYLGSAVPLDHFLYEPDSSLIKQTTDARMLNMLNLAGFGLAAWSHGSFAPDKSFLYRSTQIPLFDRNLKNLSAKINANALIAHIRGVPSSSAIPINEQNLHPFQFTGTQLTLAHNGDLARFREMRFELLSHIRPEIAKMISGSTDSEWIYALILSCLSHYSGPFQVDELIAAVRRALAIIREIRTRKQISTSSSVNLVISDGENLLATRFCFDFGKYEKVPTQGAVDYLSLWYTCGSNYGYHDGEWKMVGGINHADSVLVSSEPLTCDDSTWVEVPEYSLMYATTQACSRHVDIVALDE